MAQLPQRSGTNSSQGSGAKLGAGGAPFTEEDPSDVGSGDALLRCVVRLRLTRSARLPAS